MSSTGPSVLKRVLLILAASAVIVAFAVYQGHALVGGRSGSYSVPSGPAVIEPVEGSDFLRSYPVVFNGAKTTFGHYTARIKAQEVVKAYQEKAQGTACSSAGPMLSTHGHECSAFSYVTKAGTTIGVVAFDRADSSGSEYFVGAMTPSAARTPTDGDCAGRDAPGVPRPAQSTRVLCIENLGGLASVFVFYEAWGRPSELLEDLRHDLGTNSWKERSESSATLSGHYDGIALLSFSRGHEQCLIAIDQDARTSKIMVSVFWTERPWLPKGLAL